MDLYLFKIINQFAGKSLSLDTFGIFCAEHLGTILILILIFFLIIDFRKYFKMVLLSLISAFLSRFVIVEIIRFFWYRPRPFINNSVNLLIFHKDTGSFPSGHAAFYFAISAIVFLYNKKAGLLFFLSSFLISLARVFTGVHFLSDILIGAIIGILIGFIIESLFKKIIKKRERII